MKRFLLLIGIMVCFNSCSKGVVSFSSLPLKAFSCDDKVAPKSLDFLEQKYHCRGNK